VTKGTSIEKGFFDDNKLLIGCFFGVVS